MVGWDGLSTNKGEIMDIKYMSQVMPSISFEQMEKIAKLTVSFAFYAFCLLLGVLFVQFILSDPPAQDYLYITIVVFCCGVAYFLDNKGDKNSDPITNADNG